jgi:hypothetical protein
MLLSGTLGISAEHEPAPRANFELRSTLRDPRHGLKWLAEQKLPAIARSAATMYVETSHLYCKGFVELFFLLGLKPRFILLRRDARAVARSLFQMNVIPERTHDGCLVLVGPNDVNVLPLPGSLNFTDYQLCYWYAKEIERRQALYRGLFETSGIQFVDLSIGELVQWPMFLRLVDFLGTPARDSARDTFERIVAENQNPRDLAMPGCVDRVLPDSAATEEREVDWACAPYFLSSALSAADACLVQDMP